MKRYIAIALAIACTVLSTDSALAAPAAEAAAQKEQEALEQLLNATLKSYEGITDYTCLFDKTELVEGKLYTDKGILLKFKKPGSIYMKWTEGQGKGTEAIYDKARYGHALQVHPGGRMSFITSSLDPTGTLAMRNNRHPITEAGIGFVLALVQKNYQMAKKDPKARMQIIEERAAVTHVRAELPADMGYYGHIVDLYVERATGLPTRLVIRGWKGELLEEYAYRDLRLNTGLKDSDFDKSNPAYGF